MRIIDENTINDSNSRANNDTTPTDSCLYSTVLYSVYLAHINDSYLINQKINMRFIVIVTLRYV